MDWNVALRRQALSEWRDRQILAACEMLNNLAQAALGRFETQLNDANLVDTVWDPAGFATSRIDALLCQSVPDALRKFLVAAGAELRAIDSSFAPYGEALSRSEGFVMPELRGSIGDSADTTAAAPHRETDNGETKPSGWRMLDFAIVRRVRSVGERAATAIWEAGSAAERAVQDGAGLYSRVRAAAQQRIAIQWMGNIGEPRPVLAQVIDLIDGVTGEAKASMI